MQTYKDLPQVTLMDCVRRLKLIGMEVQSIIDADSKRHMMDQMLLDDSSTHCEELIDAINRFVDAMDEIDGYDPTPQHLFDHTGGEPQQSANEMHAVAQQQHIASRT